MALRPQRISLHNSCPVSYGVQFDSFCLDLTELFTCSVDVYRVMRRQCMYGNYFAMREPMDEKGLCNTLPLFYRGFHGFLHINVRLAYSLEGTRGKKHIPRGRVIHDKISERKLTRGGIIEYDYECHEKHFSMVSLAGPVSAERIRPEHVCTSATRGRVESPRGRHMRLPIACVAVFVVMT